MPDRDQGAGPADIASWGLASAAAVVERMLELGRSGATGLRLPFPVNGEPPSPGAAEEVSSEDRARQARRFRADAERVVELYADLTRMLVDGAAGLAEQAVGLGGPGAGGDSVQGTDVLVLGPASAGATTTAGCWLHVLDGPAAAPATLHATHLTAHDGSWVPGPSVSCDPAHVVTSAARTTSEVRVTVVVPEGTPPGTYHGHLLALGLPEVALALRLEVVA